MAARLKEHFQKTVVPALAKEFGYKNVMAVPRIEKISINIGLGEATQNAKLMDGAVNELTAIAGQKPVITKASKSIAQFKLREGQAIGCMVTLRGGQSKAPKFPCRQRNLCWRCGRPRAFLRKFGICRLCFRQLALNGDIPGVTKASW